MCCVTKLVFGNKEININKPFQKFLDDQRQAVKDLYETSHKEWQRRNLSEARGEKGREGLAGVQKIKLEKQFYDTKKKRQEDITSWYSAGVGKVEFNEITSAQREYQIQNINRYLPYHTDEILRMRNEWLDKGGYRGVIPGEGMAGLPGGMIPYGKAREASFLKYLEEHGTKMTSAETKLEIAKHDRGIENARRKALGEKILPPVEALSDDVNPDGSPVLFGPKKHAAIIRDSQQQKLNQAALAKKESETMEKQAELTSTPVVSAVNDLEDTVKDETKKSTVGIQTTQINTATELNNSISESSSISGGRQSQGRGSDGWHQRAIYSGGR